MNVNSYKLTPIILMMAGAFLSCMEEKCSDEHVSVYVNK
jgi:hypothetical protein